MTHEEIAWNFDWPRLESFFRIIGKLPPPTIMLGRLAGYKIEEPEKKIPQGLTQQQHAARLLDVLGNIG